MSAAEIDVAAFGIAFQRFMERLHELSGPRTSPLRDRVAEHLGAYPAELPTVTEQVPSTDLPNVQLAVEALLEAAPGWELIGLPAEARHYGGFSLASLLSGRMGPHIDAAPPTYVYVPVAVGEVHACVELGVYLLTYDGTPRSEEHTSELQSLMRISYAVFCFE